MTDIYLSLNEIEIDFRQQAAERNPVQSRFYQSVTELQPLVDVINHINHDFIVMVKY